MVYILLDNWPTIRYNTGRYTNCTTKNHRYGKICRIKYHTKEQTTMIDPRSWLGLAAAGTQKSQKSLITAPLTDGKTSTAWHTIPTKHGRRALLVALDAGNGAAKIVVPQAQADQSQPPQLHASRIDAVYSIARAANSEDGHTTYQIDGSPIIIGNPHLFGVTPLPTGNTVDRFGDPMYRQFVLAAIVRALAEAGHSPEQADRHPIYIYLAYAAPSDEFGTGGKVSQATAEALATIRPVIDGRAETVKVMRMSGGKAETWPIHIVDLRALPQSQGIYNAITYDIERRAVLDVSRMLTLDIGFGHTQLTQTTINEQGKAVHQVQQIGEGGVEIIAAELIKQAGAAQLNNADAQVIIATGKDADKRDRSAIRDRAIEIAGPKMLQAADKVALQTRSGHLVVTGGGAAIPALRAMLADRLRHRDQEITTIVPAEVAGYATAIGIYAYYYAMLRTLKPWQS